VKQPLISFRGTFPRAARRNSRGQTLVEYAMIIAMLSIVTIGLIYALSQQTGAMYSHIGSAMSQMTSH
jgi:Flp pilus assembly pilin Flp